jgi:hypothetical protein
MKENNYPKGSEWRKWDLHVHTPYSYLRNEFGDPEDSSTWDKYVKTLFNKAIEKNIAIIGITDYFIIDGYKKIKHEYLENENKLRCLRCTPLSSQKFLIFYSPFTLLPVYLSYKHS